MARIIEPFEQFFDGEGDPLSNGWLKFTETGTNLTDRDTFADSNLQFPNTNPLQLNSEGRCPDVFGTGSYRVTLFQNNEGVPGTQIDQKDPVSERAQGSVTFGNWDTEEIYDSGAIVVGSDGNYYKSISGDNQGNDPTTDPSRWERIDFEHFYNSGISYDTNDRVVDADSGYVYISLVDDNLNNTPSSSPTEWKDQVEINRGNIETNTTNISTNATNISTNASDISTNASDISTNASDITTVDEKYLPNNVENLLLNDTSVAPGNADIGRGYQSTQYYGQTAVGPLSVGFSAIGNQFYGQSAVGDQFYGEGAVGVINIGGSAESGLNVGTAAVGTQQYGRSAVGDQFYGRTAEGAIEIGSTNTTHSNKKLISGTKEATFEEIIDAATINTWITATLNASWSQVVGNEVKYRIYNNYLEIKGAAEYVSGSQPLLVFTLPSGYRPLTDFYVNVTHLGTPNVVEVASVLSTGVVNVYGTYLSPDTINFNLSIPLD